MAMRTHLPSTIHYLKPYTDSINTTILATTSVAALTDLIKTRLPYDKFDLVNVSFGQWIISRIDLGDLKRAQQQVINEIIGRIYQIITTATPRSKLVTPWDVHAAIMGTPYMLYFFQSTGDQVIQDHMLKYGSQPTLLPTALVLIDGTGTIQAGLSEEFIVGCWLCQLQSINGGKAQRFTIAFDGYDIGADISSIAADTRYFNTDRRYNSKVGDTYMWYTSPDFIKGVEYYSKFAQVPIDTLVKTYSVGFDPSNRPVTELLA